MAAIDSHRDEGMQAALHIGGVRAQLRRIDLVSLQFGVTNVLVRRVALWHILNSET